MLGQFLFQQVDLGSEVTILLSQIDILFLELILSFHEA